MNTFTETELIDFFRKKIASELGIALEEVEVDLEFINFGLDSVNAHFHFATHRKIYRCRP
jgi:hypothetical protein